MPSNLERVESWFMRSPGAERGVEGVVGVLLPPAGVQLPGVLDLNTMGFCFRLRITFTIENLIRFIHNKDLIHFRENIVLYISQKIVIN